MSAASAFSQLRQELRSRWLNSVSASHWHLLILLISGGVHPHPRPARGENVIPCVWSCKAICCDDCSRWSRRSCISKSQEENRHAGDSEVYGRRSGNLFNVFFISKNRFFDIKKYFLISKNIFWYKKIIFWYQKFIFWYQKRKAFFYIRKSFFDIRKSFSDIRNSLLISENQFFVIRKHIIFWYRKIIFWYQKFIFWYQKIFFDIKKQLFSDIKKSFSDIKKWFSDIKKYRINSPFARYFRVPIYSARVWGKYIMLPWFHVLAQGPCPVHQLTQTVGGKVVRVVSVCFKLCNSAESLPRHLNHVVCHSNDELELGANRGEGALCICVYLSQALAECIGTLWKAKWEFIQCFFISKNSVRSGNLFCIFWYQKIVLIFWYHEMIFLYQKFLISENDFLISKNKYDFLISEN